MIPNIEELKQHYLFSTEDENNLKNIESIMAPFGDQFGQDFYEYLLNYPEAAQFFRSPGSIEKRKETIQFWLMGLFTGKYDNRYLNKLKHVGRIHVIKGIPIHWVTASMNFKREYIIDILEREIENHSVLKTYIKSLDKILDLNLDILTSSYHEEEIKQKFLSARMDTALISFAERFTYGLNIVLVMALIGLSIGVVSLFVYEIYKLFTRTSQFEQGILSLLGTLLIIWVMIELIGTEIKYLKGARFHIEIFISVALVAFIRELLVSSLAHASISTLGLMLGAVLILGIVYFLISKTEIK